MGTFVGGISRALDGCCKTAPIKEWKSRASSVAYKSKVELLYTLILPPPSPQRLKEIATLDV